MKAGSSYYLKNGKNYLKLNRSKIENSTNNSFFCINGNGQHQKMSVQPKMSIYQKFRKTFGNNYDKNTFYSIYGISNKSWYPCFSIYPDLNLNLLDFIYLCLAFLKPQAKKVLMSNISLWNCFTSELN